MIKFIRSYIDAKLVSWLIKLPVSQFYHHFKYLNLFWLKWPISVGLSENGCCLKVMGFDKQYVFVGRASRIKLYRSGVAARLQLLESQYMLDNIQFSGGDWIIDIGANVGEVTKYLQETYNVNSVAVEPEKIERNCLEMNTRKDNTIIFDEPLWSESIMLEWYEANNTADSSLLETEGAGGVVERQTITLDEVIRRAGLENKTIKLLKLEAEGAEPEILQGAKQTLPHVMYVAADLGPERGIKNDNTVIPVMGILAGYGFVPIKFSFERGVMLFMSGEKKIS